MKSIIFGLFKEQNDAENAVAELQAQGFAQDISVAVKDDESNKQKVTVIKNDATDSAETGAMVGGATGAIAALLTGLSAVIVPGIGVLMGGPLAVLLGLTGGALGAVTGGLIGILVNAGIPDNVAKLYSERIHAGEILVAVATNPKKSSEVRQIFMKNNSQEINFIENIKTTPIM